MFKDEAVRDLLITFGVVVLIGVMWFYNGGRERAINELVNVSVGQSKPPKTPTTSRPVQTPSYQTPSDQYQQIYELQQQINQAQREIETGGVITNKSPRYEKVDITVSSVGTGNAEWEYITLTADRDNTEQIDITDWSLVSLETGSGATIGTGAILPVLTGTNAKERIVLFPGESAAVITGISPINSSFRINQCTGYFEQFKSFYPSVDRGCPRLSEEPLPKKPNALSDSCVNFISSMPSCRTMYGGYPSYVTLQCQQYINQEIGYDRCVSKHKNDPGFYSGEWQVYLGRSGTLWKSSKEIIELRDAQGRTVDRVRY